MTSHSDQPPDYHPTAQHHLYCLMQNRLGALDRVLGALTHRGILPQQMTTVVQSGQFLEMRVSFAAQDANTIDKLLRFLQKQVYVLSAQTVTPQANTDDFSADASNITPLFLSDVIPDYAQRRMAHVHNA